MTEATEHREVERKFRVGPDFRLPELAGLPHAEVVRAVPDVHLAATYHDTATLSLIRWGTTLRRREGGHDEGWHLKLPVSGAESGVRDEIRLPLASGAAGLVPAALADIVAPLTRGAALTPLAVVRTHRQPTELVADDGTVLVELVDDEVTVTNPDGTPVSSFREIEAEIVAHDDPRADAALEAACEALLAAGAEPSSVSKAASALGPLASAPPDVVPVPAPDSDGLAIDALGSVLAEHVRRLLIADVGVRRDLPDAVHQMRVSARRLRSVLRSFAPLLEPAWAEQLAEELKWMASELGAIRDTEVLQERLDGHAAELGEPDAGTARAIIDRRLSARLAAARSGALAALRSDRHGWLLDDLVLAAAQPRVTDEAFRPLADVLPEPVRKAWRKFARSVDDLGMDSASSDWHRARIRAKRARYSVDAYAPSAGKRVARFARTMADITEVLGEHQDAHVAQQTLRDLAALSDTTGVEGLALGRLLEVERAHELELRAEFLDQWPDFVAAARRAGLG